MKFKLLIMTAACVGMIACSKDGTGDNPYADGSKQVVLKVNLPATRAGVDGTWLDGNGDPQTTTISTIDVFFTNANGTVKEHYTLDTLDTDNDYLNAVQGDGLRFVGLKDVTAVYIAANVPESMRNITTMADFKVLMNQQAPSMEQDNMIFAGCDMDLIAGADTDSKIPTYGNTDNQDPTVPAEGDMVYTADVVIRPIISRIEWGNISVKKEGHKDFKQPDGSTYLVEWTGYAPTIVGVYQSNVYLAENIFGAPQASAWFATPANWTSIVNGAWVEPNPSIDGITWDNVNPSLAYSNYQAGSTGYAALLPQDYNKDKPQCVPFHFFVPFDPKSSDKANTAITGDMEEEMQPKWHFQLYYPNDSGYTITVKKKNDGEGDDKYTVVTDDKALSLMGDFLYPAGSDKIAYANVVNLKLKDNTENNDFTYRPGMIYTADIEINPYNVTLGFEDKDNYNVIVKVGVADFATQEVTPEFNK